MFQVQWNDTMIEAYTYQIVKEKLDPNMSQCKPSTVYKNVIIQGACENQLPEVYIQDLRNIEDNGYNGEVEVKLDLTKQ